MGPIGSRNRIIRKSRVMATSPQMSYFNKFVTICSNILEKAAKSLRDSFPYYKILAACKSPTMINRRFAQLRTLK